MKKSQLKALIKEIVEAVSQEQMVDPVNFTNVAEHGESDMNNPEEKREVEIGKEIIDLIDTPQWAEDINTVKIVELAQELINMHKKMKQPFKEDLSDYYSPEAKAWRDAQRKLDNQPKKKILGVRVYDIGLRDVRDAMKNHGLVRYSGGTYGLPFYQGDSAEEYKKNLNWNEDYFGRGHWKLPKKK